MSDSNLFHMLSAYRPGTPATPFDTYCTQAFAYFVATGQEELVARLLKAAGSDAGVDAVDVQGNVGDAPADLTLTLSDGATVAIEVQTELSADTSHLDSIEQAVASQPSGSLVLLGVDESALRPGWALLTWRVVARALRNGGDRLALEFAAFIERDILGAGPVSLTDSLTTNRFYALAAAAIRRRFGDRAQVTTTASQPMGSRYRYFGTSFALDGRDPVHWLGLVNETIPLGEHYDLMLASKDRVLREPAPRPRTTAEWKWPNWTTGGRIVRPIESEDVDRLLKRFPD